MSLSSMRIAMIAPFALHPKSTTRWRVLPLARALAARGHQALVVVPPYDWPEHSGQRWRDRGVDIIHVSLPAAGTFGGHLDLARRLAAVAQAWRPDVVHCFKPKGYSGLAAWLLMQSTRQSLPVVIDADDWEAGWNRRVGYPALWQRLFRWQERWGLRCAHAVTVASHWLATYAASLRQGVVGADLARRSVLYLPNGVEGDSIRAVWPRAGCGNRALLYTRFVEHTPEDVWEVWRQVAAEAPGAHLLVAGRGAHREEAQLAQLAREAGVGASVALLGWAPTASRPGLFAGSDVALLPVADTPLTRAKSPARLVEMLAHGLPVATQAVGEYAVLVRDGETGLLAPAGDARALAAAAVRLIYDGRLRHALGQAAADHMAAHYAWMKLVDTALSAYEIARDCSGAGRLRLL